MTQFEHLKGEILAHASREMTEQRECCGVVVQLDKPVYVPCRNIATDEDGHPSRDAFIIHPDDFAEAEERGEILAIVHSHVGIPAEPSEADLLNMRQGDVPWLIASVPLGDVRLHFPPREEIPLLQRPYVFGVSDCYTLVRDYYRVEKGIYLPDFYRTHDFYEGDNDLVPENLKKTGFVDVPVSELQVGDVLLLDCGGRGRINHMGILLDDNKFLHHSTGHLSRRDTYGSYWRDRTVKGVRPPA